MQVKNKKAFTLIELLVVVLIIGILAAVALPQYEKAVKKTRLVQAIPTLKAISYAKERYFLANGNYTDDLDALDVSVPYTSKNNGQYEGTPLNGILSLSNTGQAVIWHSTYGFTIEVYTSLIVCYGDDKLCGSMGPLYYTTQGGTNVYELKF